jgi:hypothetical protein
MTLPTPRRSLELATRRPIGRFDATRDRPAHLKRLVSTALRQKLASYALAFAYPASQKRPHKKDPARSPRAGPSFNPVLMCGPNYRSAFCIRVVAFCSRFFNASTSFAMSASSDFATLLACVTFFTVSCALRSAEPTAAPILSAAFVKPVFFAMNFLQ